MIAGRLRPYQSAWRTRLSAKNCDAFELLFRLNVATSTLSDGNLTSLTLPDPWSVANWSAVTGPMSISPVRSCWATLTDVGTILITYPASFDGPRQWCGLRAKVIDAPCWRLTNLNAPLDTVGPWLYAAVFRPLALMRPRTCFGRSPSVQSATRNGA